MTSEFKFKDSIYLISEDHEIDLHNSYYFRGLNYSVADRRLTLFWERGEGSWVGENLPVYIEVEFKKVIHFQFNPRDPEMPSTEDDCLSTIGYFTNEDWCEGVFVTEKDPDPEWLTAFEFMSGATILIKAEEAQVKMKFR